MSTFAGIGVAAAAALLGAVLTRLVLRWADGRLLDLPNERSSHVRPTPRGGGLAIVAVVTAGAAVYGLLMDRWDQALPWIAGTLLVAMISFVDDFRSTSSALRFTVHLLAALVAVGGLTGWNPAALPLGESAPVAGIIITGLWVAGLTNAYNFMDGIDGIAGTQAVLGGIAWALAGVIIDSPMTTLLGLLIAGAASGFLLYNRPPARIFMGDVGSAFLGFSFAVLPFVGGSGHPGMTAAATLIPGVFVFDTLITFLRRLRNGEPVLKAHRSHLYQRLATGGRTHGFVTLFYGMLATVTGVAAVTALLVPRHALAIWCTTVAVVGLSLWLTVSAYERAAIRQRAPSARGLT